MLTRIPKNALILLIRLYQKTLSPDQSFWGKRLRLRVCIFKPTCSEYSIQALRKYGVFKGSWLSLKRVLRCHPWSKGGEDKLP